MRRSSSLRKSCLRSKPNFIYEPKGKILVDSVVKDLAEFIEELKAF
jgi:hypothetical protein